MPNERGKRMRKGSVIALSVVIIFLAASVSFALIFTSDQGTWPDTWPKELERFRKQSKSYNLSSGTEEVHHEILFQKREEFEEAWPHILELKTDGAPVILESIQSARGVVDRRTEIGKPGVRVRCPSRSKRGYSEEARNRPANWLDYVRLPSGALPEYGVCLDGKWTAASYQDSKWVDDETEFRGIMYRARTDIVLIIDGNIVDLNRIPMPADTPIIDRRFKDGHNKIRISPDS
jgi:hypothetical protein